MPGGARMSATETVKGRPHRLGGPLEAFLVQLVGKAAAQRGQSVELRPGRRGELGRFDVFARRLSRPRRGRRKGRAVSRATKPLSPAAYDFRRKLLAALDRSTPPGRFFY